MCSVDQLLVIHIFERLSGLGSQAIYIRMSMKRDVDCMPHGCHNITRIPV